jgi:hypothetical protein
MGAMEICEDIVNLKTLIAVGVDGVGFGFFEVSERGT